MDVLKYYENLRNSCLGLPAWDALHPQHQHMIINSVNLLLAVLHDVGATGKTTEEKGD